MQQVAGQEGVYRVGVDDKMFNAKARVLEGAVPPLSGASEVPSPYGLVAKGLAMPGTGGSYVVECLDKNVVRVVAYVDPYGRAFSTVDALEIPPAREPSLSFARYTDQPTAGEEHGCVYLHDDGSKREVAQYRFARGCYTLFDSWYDFGPYAAGLSYDDAMARAYLAFVHRPTLGAPAVPARGLECVFERLHGDKPLAGMREIVADVRNAEADPVFQPPALVRCLAQWLVAAGLDDLAERGVGDDALRLVRTVRYAKTYYVAVEDENADVPLRMVWAIEAALNRFLLVKEALGESATLATDVDCARWDAYLIETVAMQHPLLGDLADAPEGAPGGEWNLRCAVSSAIERLRLPVRIGAALQADVTAGTMALDVTAPDAEFMPLWTWQEGAGGAAGAWAQASPESREAQARRYALHLGLVLAAAAFDAAPGVARVDLVVRSFADPASGDAEPQGEFLREDRPPAYVQVAFDRAAFEALGRFEEARAADPLPPYQVCGARFDVADAAAFAHMDCLASAALRKELPESLDAPLPEPARSALGADDSRDVRINYDGAYRRMAEDLTDPIARAESVAEAIRIVRAAQDEAAVAQDDRAVSSCTRLMAALAEGEIDRDDQNAVVSRYLGEDRCLVALGRAKTLAERDMGAAVDALISAVAEASALDGFVDGAATVYRTFDSYVARMLYNRARRTGEGSPHRAAADAARRVELAPDSFYLCHLEIVRLLEHSFERTDEALRYGQRAIEMAPATAAGYRQLGRAYMLVGDMENAAETLREGLRVAVKPSDIAMAYYQLAYVLWKAGRAQEGVACYLKSLMTSPVIAVQATAELQELVEESGVAVLPRDQVDLELARTGIPVAPTVEVLEALVEGAAAATDAGLFPVARNLLAVRLRYRPDDALVNVLGSLEE